MSTWRMRFFGVALGSAGLFGQCAVAQEIGGVSGSLNSNNGAISGANINRVNGMNANGTPRQQDPGASMVNGAGNSAMTPGVTGAIGSTNQNSTPKTVPPTVILHNNESTGSAQ